MLDKLTASRCVGLFLACVVRRPCVSQHAGTSAFKMAHNAALDIAGLVLDGGAVNKILTEQLC